jgi:nicotinamidase-related amidase
MPTLVIIDMQPGFYCADQPDLIEKVCEEVRQAIDDNSGIVVLEYYQGGKTLRKIADLLDKHHLVDYTVKEMNDGGEDVAEMIDRNYFDESHLRVCGVNTEACVAETVETLSMIYPDATIEVIEDACNGHDNSFDWVHSFHNVVLQRSIESAKCSRF